MEPSIDFTTRDLAFVRYGNYHVLVPFEKLRDLAPYYWLQEQSRKILVEYYPEPPTRDDDYALSWIPLVDYLLLAQVDLGVGTP
jgi:hypothetical protein